MSDINIFEELGKVFFIVLIILSLFEVGLLIFAYINADSVECNLLWCTFTSGNKIRVENAYSSVIQSVSSESRCYINGERVNCSDIDNSNWNEKFDR